MSATTVEQVTWPAEVTDLLGSAMVCEYASLTRDGRPVTWPISPYLGDGTIDVSTGLTYPDKAERARRDPRVALLFSDGSHTGLADAPVVLVRGRATVRDADLQANTDRYVRESLVRTRGMGGLPWFAMRGLGWYFARIWVEVTPLEVTWWPSGELGRTPRVWRPDVAPSAPPSDPRPRGPRTARVAQPVADWPVAADRAEHLGMPVLTTSDASGPLPLRCTTVERTATGYVLRLPEGMPAGSGAACLTFHRFGDALAWQENVVLMGRVEPAAAGSVAFTVERALPDWSLPGGRLSAARGFLRRRKELSARVAEEAARRAQPVPELRRPA